jgi:hypothetical protein
MKTALAVPIDQKNNANNGYDYGLDDKQGINVLHSKRLFRLAQKLGCQRLMKF